MRTTPSNIPNVDSLSKVSWLVNKIKDGSYEAETLRKAACGLLQDLYLPQAPHIDYNSPIYSWVFALCQLKNPSKALDQAIVAFCAIQFFLSPIGKAKSSHLPILEPFSLYNNALSSVRKMISDNTGILEAEVFGAIVMLSTCEVCIYPNSCCFFAVLS
jgi:hypothetical protein